MPSPESRKQRIVRVSKEVSGAIRREIRLGWKSVRTAERNEPGHHVWRFRSDPAADGRFLYIEHRAMTTGREPATRLLEQLAAESWLDRLQNGPETALLLSSDGRLSPYQPRG